MANEDTLAALDAVIAGSGGATGQTDVITTEDFSGGTLPSGGKAFDFMAGAGKFTFEHLPGMGGVFPEPPDTFAAKAGGMAIPAAAGVAAGIASGGSSLLAQSAIQGGLSAGIELVRSGSTSGSVATAGATGAALTPVGNLAGRAMNSILSAGGRAATRAAGAPGLRPIIDFADDLRGGFVNTVARMRSGAGAFNFALRNNVKAMNERVAKVFEFTDDAARKVDELGPGFLKQARRVVNRNYKNAEPTEAFEAAAVKKTLERIPGRLVPDTEDAINMIDDYQGHAMPPETYQGLQRIIRDGARELRGTRDGRSWGRIADEALDQLDTSAAAAGGNKALLSRANQQYKMLATLEEVNAVIEAGEIPAGQLVRLMGRENFKGYGRRAIAEGLGDHIMPEIAEVLRAGKQMARFSRDIAGGSATSGRQATFGPAQGAVQGILSGEKGIGEAAVQAAGGMSTPLIGHAATEAAGVGTRGLTGALAQGAANDSQE